MNAYLDLSYIFHILILFTLPYYHKRILNEKLNKLLLISLIVFSLVLYFNVFIFGNYKYINLVFLLVYFLLIYKDKFLKYYLLYLFVYYSNVATTMIFSNDIYLYKGLVFLNSENSFIYIIFILMNIIFIEIIFFSIKSIKLLRNYKSKVKIKVKDKFISCSAYMDSGNTVCIDGLPVVFLRECYFNRDDKEIVISGIGKKVCKYFKSIIILNEKEKEVIVASGSNNGFKGCDCLLNIHLLEGEE